MKKIYYIETSINGYVISKIKIGTWNPNKDYAGELTFRYGEGTEENYYDITGDMDRLDNFLKIGADMVEGNISTKDNIMLEYWLTDTLGYYTDKYIGLMIK